MRIVSGIANDSKSAGDDERPAKRGGKFNSEKQDSIAKTVNRKEHKSGHLYLWSVNDNKKGYFEAGGNKRHG